MLFIVLYCVIKESDEIKESISAKLSNHSKLVASLVTLSEFLKVKELLTNNSSIFI